MYLLKVDHHNDAVSLETTFPIPEGYSFLQAHDQGRVVGFLIQRPPEPPRAVVIHLDCPGVSMESEVPPAYTAEIGPTVSGLSFSFPWRPLTRRGFLGLSLERLHPDRKSGNRLQYSAHFSL